MWHAAANLVAVVDVGGEWGVWNGVVPPHLGSASLAVDAAAAVTAPATRTFTAPPGNGTASHGNRLAVSVSAKILPSKKLSRAVGKLFVLPGLGSLPVPVSDRA